MRRSQHPITGSQFSICASSKIWNKYLADWLQGGLWQYRQNSNKKQVFHTNSSSIKSVTSNLKIVQSIIMLCIQLSAMQKAILVVMRSFHKVHSPHDLQNRTVQPCFRWHLISRRPRISRISRNCNFRWIDLKWT